MGKGRRKPVASTTLSRSIRRLQRVFVDLSGPRTMASSEGALYIMIVKDDFSRYAWTYHLRQKSDAAAAFKRFLADVRNHGTPSLVECVRSDNGGEFAGRAFRDLCDERGIRQEFTTPDTPKLNGVAERGLGLIQDAAAAAMFEAPRLFPDIQLAAGTGMWAEACVWACDAFNKLATTANPGDKSPHELFLGPCRRSPCPHF